MPDSILSTSPNLLPNTKIKKLYMLSVIEFAISNPKKEPKQIKPNKRKK